MRWVVWNFSDANWNLCLTVLFRCKSYEKAKKKLTVLEEPNILTIVLKRFEVVLFLFFNFKFNFVLLMCFCSTTCACSLGTLGSWISQFGSLNSSTWPHIWVELVMDLLCTAYMQWLFTWMLQMLHFQVIMCAMWRIPMRSGSELMTAPYVPWSLICLFYHY